MRIGFRRATALTAITALAAAVSVTVPALPAAAAPTPATFNKNLQLKSSESAGEPSIRTDQFGRSFVIGPIGVGGGCKAFRVTHDGSSSQFLGFPDQTAGGGDCDWGIGPQETTVPATDNVLAFSSLSLANITVGKSDDGGTTFGPPNVAATQVAGDDRMWQAADPKLNGLGLADVFMTYHDVSLGEIELSVSLDGGQSYAQNSPLINFTQVPAAQVAGALAGNELGNIVAFRPKLGNGSLGPLTLYSIFQTPDSSADNANQGVASTANFNRVYAAVAHVPDPIAGPLTWNDYEIYHGPASSLGSSMARYNRIFPVIAVDSAGKLYAFWSDGNHIDYKVTTDPTNWDCPSNSAPDNQPGLHCTPFGQIANPIGVTTAIMPWAQAGSGGIADVVYYGAHGGSGSGPNPQDDPKNIWDVYFAQTADGGTSWTVSTASDHDIHLGPICIDGLACDTSTPRRNRTLLDFFQVSIDPTNGAADLSYTDDHATTGSSVLYFTRQCIGLSATTGLALVNDCKAPPPPPIPPKGTTCPGPQILDFAGDAPNNYPAGDGQNMKMLDILNAFFGTPDSAHLRVTLTLNNLSAPPPPLNFTSGIWTVYWQYKNATSSQWWFVQASNTGSSITYRDGIWDASGDTDTTVNASVPGSFNTGSNGTIVWTIPRTDVMNPTTGAKLTNTFANTGGAYLVNGTGVRFTHAADRGPDANYGADYFVGQTCQGGGGGGGGGGCREADGTGNVQGKNGGNANFQSDEDGCLDGDQNGEQVSDPGAKEDFRSTQVQSVQFDDSTGTMTVYGLGVSNGLPVSFLIVEQAATAATPAFYSIELSDGYVNSGNLTVGTITLR